MQESILNSIKKLLGPGSDDPVFNPDIIMHINSALSTLTQLGVGPKTGYSVKDDTDTWSDFAQEDPRMNFIKTYVFLKVKLVFDPPPSSFVVASMEKQASELEWRIEVARDTIEQGGTS